MQQHNQSDKPKLRGLARRQALPLIVAWLKETYVEEAGHTIERHKVYEDYCQFCQRSQLQATTSAALGKLVKRVFPNVGWRRLGKRGQSKMHYANIRRKTPVANLPGQDLSSLSPSSLSLAARTEEDTSPEQIEDISAQHYIPGVRGIELEDGNCNDCQGKQANFSQEAYCGVSASSSPEIQSTDKGQRPTLQPYAAILESASAHLNLMATVRYYRDIYRKSSWEVIPINPMCLKMKLIGYLFSENGLAERSSLSLSAWVMMSVASFTAGHVSVSEEFFQRAREQLAYVFDQSDYDVASALVPLSWLSTLFSSVAEQGRHRQVYYCTIGTKICEQIGAVNDRTYWLMLCILHSKSMESAAHAIVKTQAYPAYQPRWKKTRLRRETPTKLFDQYGEMLSTALSLSVPILEGVRLSGEQYHHIRYNLSVLLGRIMDAERHLKKAAEKAQVKDMMSCYYLSIRVFIHVLLGNSQQIQTTRQLANTLLTAERPVVLVVLHELSANEYLLIGKVIQVLVEYREYKLLEGILETIRPFVPRFFWLCRISTIIQESIGQSLRTRPIPMHPPISSALKSPDLQHQYPHHYSHEEAIATESSYKPTDINNSSNFVNPPLNNPSAFSQQLMSPPATHIYEY